MGEPLKLPPQCCGTCKHWKRGAVLSLFKKLGPSGSGVCENMANSRAHQMEGHSISLVTLDMALCSNWETAEPSLWDPEAEKAASERQGSPHTGEEASEATTEPSTGNGLPDAS